MNQIKGLIFLILTLTIFKPSYAQDVKLSVNIDKNKIQIGDHIHLTVDINYSTNTALILPKLKDTLSSKIEIVEQLKTDTIFSTDKSSINLKEHYIITSFDTGYVEIPAYQLAYVVGNDTIQLLANKLTVFVETINVDTNQDIKDIKGILDVPFDWTSLLIYLALAVLLLAAVWIFWKYFKKKKTEIQSPIVPEIQISNQEWALQALEAIRQQQLWQNNQIKAYYVALAEVLRTYIEKEFKIMALEMTTDELMAVVKFNPRINTEAKEKLYQVLALADLVKFAKAQPIATENLLSFENAKNFILLTTEQQITSS